nr:toprim domain-containing protein [Saccharofermentans sp.]
SDKRYSFKLIGNRNEKTVHVFESAPDLLSYATLLKMDGLKWQEQNYLSLAGISDAGSVIPRALQQLLEDYPQIRTVHLHLDNDPPGRKASIAITAALEGRCVVFDVPPSEGKDFNDYLKIEKAKQKPKKTEVR